MDTKKLIGMLIGIVMFAALIAGATFAWLTFTANFTNNIVTGSSRDFTFEYSQGTDITVLEWTTSWPVRNIIQPGNGYLTISATKAKRTPEASSFKIIFQKDTMDIGVNNLVKYAICRSNTESDCNYDSTDTIPTTVGGNWVAIGSIETKTGQQILFDDTETFNVYSETNSVTGNYYLYMWLDSAVLTNDNLSQADQKEISGYVYAEAVQGENASNVQ